MRKKLNDLVIVYIFCYITYKWTYQNYLQWKCKLYCNKVGNCSIIPCPVCIFYNSHENELMKRLQGRVKKWSGLSKKLVKSLSSWKLKSFRWPAAASTGKLFLQRKAFKDILTAIKKQYLSSQSKGCLVTFTSDSMFWTSLWYIILLN